MKIIDFYGKRRIFFAISLFIFLLGLIMSFVNGIKLDIYFQGGAMLKYTYEGEIDANAAGEVAEGVVDRAASAQITTDLATEEKHLIINIAGNFGLAAEDQQALDKALKESFPNAELTLSESSMVEPFFGKLFLRKGILSVLLSLALVMLYVWVRFRRIGGLSAGVMALVALMHDLLVVFFTCVIFSIPIGDSFIAVALSIIGYSINDTIVIYDRIRENYKRYSKLPIETLTNLSITQSMMRSINTNVAVMISVSLVYILAFGHGVSSIESFALPMAVGAISGCYSTVCITGPIWVMWKKRK